MAVNQETLETLGGIKESVDSIKAGNGAAKDGVTDREESLEKLVERLEQSLTDEMKEIIDAINGKNKKGKETKDAAANIFSEEDIEQLSGVVNGGTEEKITPPKSGKVAPNDLSKIDQTAALGSLLIYYKLDEIKQALDPLILKLTKGGLSKDKSQTGSEGINIADSGNMATMVSSLKEFAKAAILLALIPKGPASAGVTLFEEFVKSMNQMAESVDAKKQEDFAKSLSSMSESIKKLAGACLLLSVSIIFIAISVPAMLLLKEVVRLAGEAGELVGSNAINLAILSVGAVLLAVSFILFGAAFVVMASVLPKIPAALLGILAVIGVLAVTLVLGALMSYAIPILAIFPLVAILVAVGYIAMAAAILVLSNIKVDQEKLKKGIDGIKMVLEETVQLGIACLPLIILMVPFILTAGLMFVGFTALYFALFSLALISFFIGTGEWMDTAVAKIIKFFKAFGTEEFLKIVGLALLGSLAIAVTSVALLIAFVAMTANILLLKAIDTLITDDSMIPRIMGEGGAISQIMDNTVALSLKALVATVAAVPLVAFGVVFLVAMASIALAFGAVVLVDKALSTIKDPKSLGDKSRDICVNLLLSIMGLDADGSISAGDLVKGGLNMVGMTAAAVLIVPFAVAAALAMVSLLATVESIKALSKIIDSFGPGDVENVMSVMGTILGTLAESAEAFKGTSAKTITAMGSLVKDVAEAISTLTDVVLKLKDGIPDEQIDAAVFAIKRICEKLFGNPDVDEKGSYNLTVLFKQLANSKLKKLKADAVAALLPIIDSIDSLADLVVKVSDEDKFSQQRIDIGTANIERFLGLVINVASAMKSLVKVDGGWLGAKLLGNKSPLEAVEEVVNSGFFDKFTSMINQMSSAANIVGTAKVEEYQGFIDFWKQDFSKMSESSSEFKAAFKNINDAFKNVNDKALDAYERFIRISTMATSGATQTISSLTTLANLSPKFVAIADAFSKMASSMETMAKKTGKLNEMFDKMKKAEKTATAMANVSEGNISTSSNAVQGDNSIGLLYAIVDSWNRNGVPVRASINSAEGKIEPDNVNNKTGISDRRNW